MNMKSITVLSLPLALLGLSSCQTDAQAPLPIGAIPTPEQIAWQEMETYAFVHFGLNTYNDLEWGYGNTPASTFAPDTLDVEQWVSTFVKAGMKGVILTAKHHDGFCLWQTKTTDYSVKNSPWKGGKGDLVKELSDACRKHGLKFGLYLSPWDRNNAMYGKPEYQSIFHEQIRELATGYGELFEYWFDGANGGNGYYGGANEKRSIDPETYYGYEAAVEILRQNNPKIMIFGGTQPTIRWVGNEEGWAGETNYSTYSYAQERDNVNNLAQPYKQAQWGIEDANEWLPAEVDVSIRPGWFYHARQDGKVRNVGNLINLYYQSVGRNATLLLNFPVALDGRIPKTDSINTVQWHEHMQKSFANDLLKDAQVEANNERRGKAFQARNLIDGTNQTYWATEDDKTTAEVIFSFEPRTINNVLLQEYIPLGQRVQAFALEIKDSRGEWQAIPTEESMTTIGYKRIIRTKPVETTALRLRITKAKGAICLARVAAYLTPEQPQANIVTKE